MWPFSKRLTEEEYIAKKIKELLSEDRQKLSGYQKTKYDIAKSLQDNSAVITYFEGYTHPDKHYVSFKFNYNNNLQGSIAVDFINNKIIDVKYNQHIIKEFYGRCYYNSDKLPETLKDFFQYINKIEK
jgi:hypothetical protein